jgi:hypothetical protein
MSAAFSGVGIVADGLPLALLELETWMYASEQNGILRRNPSTLKSLQRFPDQFAHFDAYLFFALFSNRIWE